MIALNNNINKKQNEIRNRNRKGMSYKKIEFQEGKIKETWVGSVSNLIQAHPNCLILNIEVIESVGEDIKERNKNPKYSIHHI